MTAFWDRSLISPVPPLIVAKKQSLKKMSFLPLNIIKEAQVIQRWAPPLVGMHALFVRRRVKATMKLLNILLVSLLLSSCGGPDIRIKRKVAEREIVGTWHLDPKSSALVLDHDGDDYLMDASKPHVIVFDEDGTCRYSSVMQMPTRYVDSIGDWSIVPTSNDPRGSKVDIRLKTDGGGTHMFSLDIKEESGELILWEFWSDPDLWNFLEYKRKDTKQ